MLSQYLVHRVFPRDSSEFVDVISRTDPKREQPTEGLKRFLFYASRGKENVAFGKFYRAEKWYTDVYHHEVFNLDTRSLEPADGEEILAILKREDNFALSVARRLAYRWNRGYWPYS